MIEDIDLDNAKGLVDRIRSFDARYLREAD